MSSVSTLTPWTETSGMRGVSCVCAEVCRVFEDTVHPSDRRSRDVRKYMTRRISNKLCSES